MRTILFIAFVLALVACTGSSRPSAGAAADGGNTGQGGSVSKGIEARPASSTECAAGGQVYVIYLDLNADGVRQDDETIVNSQVVCSGVNGADGVAGHDGASGHGLVFDVVAAPPSVCGAGGSVLLLALDLLETGVYDASLPNQRAITVCNGVNGADAPVSAYSPVEPIYACGNSVAYKEVLLRLQNGQVLGAVSRDVSGAMTRLAFLPDGTFINTDDSGCTFSLSTSPDGLTRSISWSGSVQMTWSVSP